ncbi:hypothetical protein CEXT_163841 [Caerostris extrusa]|uniref:Uncharacterized protein n=1 Tax=Caerostris extrusa TaxID=172846 RepID=A0AAV4U8N7_CAEEX|nr:hypothetical protein CEXT_163841 [Caerostris extrusa]
MRAKDGNLYRLRYPGDAFLQMEQCEIYESSIEILPLDYSTRNNVSQLRLIKRRTIASHLFFSSNGTFPGAPLLFSPSMKTRMAVKS